MYTLLPYNYLQVVGNKELFLTQWTIAVIYIYVCCIYGKRK